MRLAPTWLDDVPEPASPPSVALIVLGLLALGVLTAPPAMAATDDTGDRGLPDATVRSVTVGPASVDLPGVRPVVEPRRGHRFALSSDHLSWTGDLLAILGHDPGGKVDVAEVLRAGELLGVGISWPVTAGDVAALLAAHRRHAVRPLSAVGIDVGSSPGHGDLRRAAGALGVSVGDRVVSPNQVQRIIRAANSRPTTVFASTAGVPIHTPTRHVRLVGFHQASFAVARQMTAHDRVPIQTLPSRGRATGSRSAADVSMTGGRPVIAPVTGTVVEVQHYALYGRYADARVRIVPDANRQMLVTVLHVTNPTVRVGSRIQGGKDTIARSATKFPFVSQIDDVAGDHPHVHIEVRGR